VSTRGWNFRVRHRKPVRQEKLLVQLFVVIKSRAFKEIRFERHEHFRLQVFVFARQREVPEVRRSVVRLFIRFAVVAVHIARRRFLDSYDNKEREREKKKRQQRNDDDDDKNATRVPLKICA
jgi:hypothetical protein|tara:strand:- start:231 stop:596 length:366 start_codon:yes stop_codon:yes gene_type:complete